jgi:hypothetical protein
MPPPWHRRDQKSPETDHKLERAAITALAQGIIRALIEIIFTDFWHRGLW